MDSIIWLNGGFVEKDQALLHIDDSGFTNALGVLDSMLAVDGKPVAAEDHFGRLARDCETVLRIEIPVDFGDFYNIAEELLHQNKSESPYANVRAQITGGILPEFLGMPKEPTLSFTCRSVNGPDKQDAIKAWVISDYPRIARCALENCKRMDYTRNTCALHDAKGKDGNDAIMTNTDGNIACATTSALFIVEGGKAITPPLSDGVLDSISRRSVVLNMKATQESISIERLENAEEIFLCNSVKGIRPVIELNGKSKESKMQGAINDLHHNLFKAI